MPILATKRYQDLLECIQDLEELQYCVNCVDECTKQRGTFAYNAELYQYNMGHRAISPVFATVGEFYNWAAANGFPYHRRGEMLTMSRNFE